MEPPTDGPIISIEEPGVKAEGKLLYDMRREVAELLGRNQTGFPGSQPVSFGRQHLDELLNRDYFVCEKSDGIRYLLYSTADEHSNETHYLIDRKNDYWFIANRNLHFPLENNRERFHTNTITDGELVWDELPNGKREPTFLVFDCLVLDGTSLMDRSLDKRFAYARERLFAPYHKLFEDFPDERQYQPFFLVLKEFGLGYGIEQMFRQVIPNLKHGNDGLIFTCRNTPYKHGTDPHILKWKPAEENTIDCRMRLTFPTVEPTEAERREGITEPFIDYDSVPKADLYIFTGNSGPEKYELFSNLYITEAEWETLKGLGDPLNDRIVECHQDEQKRWRIVRFRDDKEEANHKSTLLSVLDSINDCVSLAELCKLTLRIRENWKARQGAEAGKKPA